MCELSSTENPSPRDIENLFAQACQLHQDGKLEKALKLYRQLLKKLPGLSLLHFNCGLVLFELGLFQDAENHYRKAAGLQEDDPDIHYNRGLNFRRLYKFSEAAQSFGYAIKAGDTTVDTFYNLALCHQDMEDYAEAERLYMRILKETPDHLSSLNNYAYLCHKSGNIKKAEQLYRQLLIYNPQHQGAKHMLDSLSGETPDTAPLEYVEAVFDNYATEFEQSLIDNLEYRTPTTLHTLYNNLFPDSSRILALDLGCGTGLAGQEFNDCCREIIGVDISEKMLHVAAEKKIYKKLIKDDILHFLQNSSDVFDLIVAVDVFTYMGCLEQVFASCSNSSSDKGLFLFSVEVSHSETFELKTTGRFGHSHDYINMVSQKTGWTILESVHTRLRKERGEWIEGFIFILEKHSDPPGKF